MSMPFLYSPLLCLIIWFPRFQPIVYLFSLNTRTNDWLVISPQFSFAISLQLQSTNSYAPTSFFHCIHTCCMFIGTLDLALLCDTFQYVALSLMYLEILPWLCKSWKMRWIKSKYQGLCGFSSVYQRSNEQSSQPDIDETWIYV